MYVATVMIAERLSARQLIVQCGLKSQLAYISVTLRNAIKSPVTFLIRVITMSVRSVYVLLLQLKRNASGPGGTPGVKHVLTSYMDTAFVLLTPEGLEIWTNRSFLFTQVGLLQLQRD